jgi:hypothetical protein
MYLITAGFRCGGSFGGRPPRGVVGATGKDEQSYQQRRERRMREKSDAPVAIARMWYDKHAR